MPYLFVCRIVYDNDLLNSIDLRSLLGSGLDTTSSDKSVDGTTQLLSGSDCTERSGVQLSISLFQHCEDREQSSEGRGVCCERRSRGL